MRNETSMRDERGFALPAAIGALTILGILVTAGFFMARQELRIGVASNYSNMAVNIAQVGANEVMANWNGYQLGLITPWDSAVISGTAAGGNWQVNVVNANNYVYRITASGEVTEGGAMWAGASRTITVVARMLFADIDPPGALTTMGNVEVKGTSQIDGANFTPGPWAPYCTTVPAGDLAGVVTDAGGTVTTSGGGTVEGTPPSVQDPAVGGCDHDIDDMVDCHEALDELLECGAIFEDDTGDPKVFVAHGTGQQDASEFFQLVVHGLASGFNEIPTQGRAGHDENKAEKHHEFQAEAEEPIFRP